MKLSSPAFVILPISASPGIKQMKSKKRAIHPPINVLYEITLGTSLG